MIPQFKKNYKIMGQNGHKMIIHTIMTITIKIPKQEESIFEIQHEIFTVIINNEWLVTNFVSTRTSTAFLVELISS